MLRALFERVRPKFSEGGEHSGYRPLFEMVDHFLYSSGSVTTSGPHVRDSINVQRVMMYFMIATLPAWLIGLWALGHQSNLAMAALEVSAAPGWRGELLAAMGIGYDPDDVFACMAHALVWFMPILLMALAVSAFWESLFALARNRPVDEDVLPTVWLYALILPATTPMYQVAIGITFGVVIGKLIFGGTGRYIVHPSLLGFTFLFFAYPDLVFGQGWIPVEGHEARTALEVAAAGGLEAMVEGGRDWWELFIGDRQGPVGVVSTLGAMIGAVFLLITGMASWRVMAGTLIAAVVTVSLFGLLGSDENPWSTVPWHWHLVTGGLAYGAIFLATDPVASSMTNAGRWIFGALVGFLTIVIRYSNPSYNEGIVFAVLLAAMFSPLIDYGVMSLNIRRRQKRLAEVTS